MRLDDERESSNLEDRRGGRGLPVGGKGIGIGTIALVLVAMYFGVDPSTILNVTQGIQQQAPTEAQPIPADDPMAIFVAKVLASTEDTWGTIFQNAGQVYPAPKLVLFSDQTPTACGSGQAAMGPFYCPADQKVYIDGRCDMYGEDFVTRFVDIYTTKPGWENALKEDQIDYVLVEPNTYLAYALKKNPDWITVFSDTVSVLYKYENQQTATCKHRERIQVMKIEFYLKVAIINLGS